MSLDPDAREIVLTVRKKSEIADGVFLFELRSPTGADLPAFTPGSHITVTAPSGQKRRYSLCNDNSERDHYLIAVKQEPIGRGGSLSFTKDVREGDQVTAEPPANEFEMSAAEPRSFIFIAGGIGITPIRAMILHCIRQGKPNFKLYYFTRAPSALAFREEFSARDFAGKVVLHHDNVDPEQAYDHWPDSAVNFEDFVGASAPHADDKPFEVNLARSRKRYEVAAGVSILDTLRNNGHVLASSCESGTCGT